MGSGCRTPRPPASPPRGALRRRPSGGSVDAAAADPRAGAADERVAVAHRADPAAGLSRAGVASEASVSAHGSRGGRRGGEAGRRPRAPLRPGARRSPQARRRGHGRPARPPAAARLPARRAGRCARGARGRPPRAHRRPRRRRHRLLRRPPHADHLGAARGDGAQAAHRAAGGARRRQLRRRVAPAAARRPRGPRHRHPGRVARGDPPGVPGRAGDAPGPARAPRGPPRRGVVPDAARRVAAPGFLGVRPRGLPPRPLRRRRGRLSELRRQRRAAAVPAVRDEPRLPVRVRVLPARRVPDGALDGPVRARPRHARGAPRRAGLPVLQLAVQPLRRRLRAGPRRGAPRPPLGGLVARRPAAPSGRARDHGPLGLPPAHLRRRERRRPHAQAHGEGAHRADGDGRGAGRPRPRDLHAGEPAPVLSRRDPRGLRADRALGAGERLRHRRHLAVGVLHDRVVAHRRGPGALGRDDARRARGPRGRPPLSQGARAHRLRRDRRHVVGGAARDPPLGGARPARGLARRAPRARLRVHAAGAGLRALAELRHQGRGLRPRRGLGAPLAGERSRRCQHRGAARASGVRTDRRGAPRRAPSRGLRGPSRGASTGVHRRAREPRAHAGHVHRVRRRRDVPLRARARERRAARLCDAGRPRLLVRHPRPRAPVAARGPRAGRGGAARTRPRRPRRCAAPRRADAREGARGVPAMVRDGPGAHGPEARGDVPRVAAGRPLRGPRRPPREGRVAALLRPRSVGDAGGR